MILHRVFSTILTPVFTRWTQAAITPPTEPVFGPMLWSDENMTWNAENMIWTD